VGLIDLAARTWNHPPLPAVPVAAPSLLRLRVRAYRRNPASRLGLPVALAIAAKNATANAVDLLLQGPPLLHRPCPAHITCILVGDLFYERSTASALWAWLRTAHRQGVRVLIADASRPFAPTAGVRCLWEERLATAWAWEGTHARTVQLLTLDA